ncbi:MAG: precorrin-6y C5,15-methyltransferase (decarboxylating) subunit CbiE [Planctomycetes bacterium]|nr:precorrin-6y C5,15-methyltransferase (decarboxylating) subunit CbiE [Planctomycetota bacterium]
MKNRITIIGIGDDGARGLTQQACDLIHRAPCLIGPSNLLAKFPEYSGRRETTGSDLDQLAHLLDRADDGAVVLASGDPLFYGTARFLCDRLGKDRFEVVPHVSSMQLAFARVKESWDEAYLTNLATQPIDRVIERIRTAEKVGLFTSEELPPPRLAEVLIAHGIDYFIAYVCENLGAPDERVTRATLAEVVQQRFAPLNVMILIRVPGSPDRPSSWSTKRLFGNPDEAFRQSKPKRGLLTPSEIRAIALSELHIRPASIVWDIGAGSGSVAIEAAQIAHQGKVYAIEMDAEDYGLMIENAKLFQVKNFIPVLGEAPSAWEKLPDPDAIFIGGTGRWVTDLVAQSWPHLKPGGSLVANVASMENVVALQHWFLQQRLLEPQLWMIQISRGNQQFETHRLESANPSFLLRATKQMVS